VLTRVRGPIQASLEKISYVSIPSVSGPTCTTTVAVFTSEATRGRSQSSDARSSGLESCLKLARQQQKPPLPGEGGCEEL